MNGLEEQDLARRERRSRRALRALWVATLGTWAAGGAISLVSKNPLWWIGGLFVAVSLIAAERRVEKYANALHQRYVASVSLRDDRPPILVLRSFTQAVLTESRPTYHLRGGFGDDSGTTFLWNLSEAATPIARLVAIGAPPREQHLRAAEAMFFMTSDEAWFECFRIAAVAANAVIAIPDVSEGVAREIRAIRDLGLTDKLLIFMPPTEKPYPRAGPFRTREPEAFASRWDTVARKWAREGYSLPSYDVAGMLYRAKPDLSIGDSVTLQRWASVPMLRGALERLLPSGRAGVPLRETIVALEQAGATILA